MFSLLRQMAVTFLKKDYGRVPTAGQPPLFLENENDDDMKIDTKIKNRVMLPVSKKGNGLTLCNKECISSYFLYIMTPYPNEQSIYCNPIMILYKLHTHTLLHI